MLQSINKYISVRFQESNSTSLQIFLDRVHLFITFNVWSRCIEGKRRSFYLDLTVWGVTSLQFKGEGKAPRDELDQTETRNWETTTMNIFARFANDESGATAIEYGLIAAIVGVGIITSLGNLKAGLDAIFNSVNSTLSTAA